MDIWASAHFWDDVRQQLGGFTTVEQFDAEEMPAIRAIIEAVGIDGAPYGTTAYENDPPIRALPMQALNGGYTYVVFFFEIDTDEIQLITLQVVEPYEGHDDNL